MPGLLTSVLVAPLLGLLVLVAIPSSSPRRIRIWANLASFVSALLTLLPAFSFNNNQDFQFVEKLPWIPSLGASYHIGLDGISLPLIIMTGFITFLAILSSWNVIETRVKEYYGWFLFLQFAMTGVFLALDFLLFFVFWEMVLIPMYFIIAIWGGERRAYASMKFLIYTVVGSVLMLVGGILLHWRHFQATGVRSWDLFDLMSTPLSASTETWIFWALFAGFAVKVPMFPFHTWLPDAHTEAPTAGSVVLASILLKMGTYGFLRFSLPLAPNASRAPETVALIAALSIIAIIYGALVCLMQKDWKKLIAYSSVSHMGFVTLSIFALNQTGLAGSMMAQINHGISAGMLFLVIGVVYERRHTREISDYGGLWKPMPVFTFVVLIASLSSMGMPPLNGFIGEMAILQGVYPISWNWAIACITGIVLGAAYLLWVFQRTMLGETSEKNSGLPDLTIRELLVFAPLILSAFAIGLWPRPLFEMLERPCQKIVERVAQRQSAPIQAFSNEVAPAVAAVTALPEASKNK